MKSIMNEPAAQTPAQVPPETEMYPSVSLVELLRSWEFYLVVIVAAFLRLYQLNTTEFDDDQAAIFQMASNAVHHGFLVATSNVASLHVYNPPATIYLLMLPAAFTSNPLSGTILTALMATAAVILTYIFVRRYYGRLAATIAALIYATSFRAIVYSRFTWNQNFLPLFVVLTFIVIFWGVVARKKGWFFPAVCLIGLTIQFHGSGVFLAFPLALAFILAPGTIRKRDLAIGVGLLLIIYAPYLLWELSTHLADIKLLLSSKSHQGITNASIFMYYDVLFNPYGPLSPQNPLHWQIVPFIGEQSYLGQLSPYLAWISRGIIYLFAACTVFVLIIAAADAGMRRRGKSNGLWFSLKHYWQHLRSSPARCGLLLLLSWQIIPLGILLLASHSLALYLHYFIIFLPGPFILLGVGLSKAISWAQTSSMQISAKKLFRYGVCALAGVIIIAQGIGSLAGILDLDLGHYSDGSTVNNLYNDLRSLRNAVDAADQLAQKDHLSRVYMSTDWPTQSSLRFLSTQMHTPATLFNDQGCVVLPGANEGPAVMLVGPYSNFTDALIRQFASATLISQPPRSGGSPFRLYIVNTRYSAPVAGSLLGNSLQLLNAPAQPFTFQSQSWLVSQWELTRSMPAAYRQVYGYSISQASGENSPQSVTNPCELTSMRAGDRLLLPLKQNTSSPEIGTPSLNVQIGVFEISPRYLKYGPLTFETYADTTTPTTFLKTATGQDQLSIPVGQ